MGACAIQACDMQTCDMQTCDIDTCERHESVGRVDLTMKYTGSMHFGAYH
jgi:hypothetical protein